MLMASSNLCLCDWELGTHSSCCFCRSWTCIEPLFNWLVVLVRTPSILAYSFNLWDHPKPVVGFTVSRSSWTMWVCPSTGIPWYISRTTMSCVMENLATALGRRNGLRVFARAVDRVHGTVGCHQSRVGWGPPDGARDAGWWGWNIHGQWTSRNAQLKFWGTYITLYHITKNHHSIYRNWTGIKPIKRGTVEVKI